jgi:hypothetical protein
MAQAGLARFGRVLAHPWGREKRAHGQAARGLLVVDRRHHLAGGVPAVVVVVSIQAATLARAAVLVPRCSTER